MKFLKTWIKQGFFEKSNKELKGALDFQMEVMDSMIREEILVTSNCCDYYPTFPVVTEGEFENLPVLGVAFVESSGNYLLVTKLPSGSIVFSNFGAI